MILNLRKTLFFIGFVMVFCSNFAFAQTMYKCVQNGQNTYQSTPCPTQAKQNTLELNLKTPSAASTPASSTVPANTPEIDKTIEFISTYQACAGVIKMFADEMSVPYEQWRVRNWKIVSAIEKDPALLSQIQKKVEQKRNGKAGMCRTVGLELRGAKD